MYTTRAYKLFRHIFYTFNATARCNNKAILARMIVLTVLEPAKNILYFVEQTAK